MHCPMPLSTRTKAPTDCGFHGGRGAWKPSSRDIGMTVVKFLGSQRLYMDFRLHGHCRS